MEVWLNDSSGEVENLVMARKQIEEFANKLNSFTYEKNGEEIKLSPLQKYFICYNFVANRVYNMDENYGKNDMRNWIGVLTTDKVICSGFSSLLKCICDRVFDSSELICYRQGLDVFDKEGNLKGGHANNLVIVNDQVLGVSGLFTSDACWGSPKERTENKVSYEYALNPISLYAEHKKFDFELPQELYFYNLIKTKESSKHTNTYKSSLLKDIKKKTGAPELLSKDYLDRNRFLTKRHNDQIKSRREKIKEKNKQEFKVFARENNLEGILKIVVPSWYPQSYKEKFPVLDKYENFFTNHSLEELKQNVHLFKEFEEFYNSHKDVFDALEQKAKDVGLYKNIFTPIEKIIEVHCLEHTVLSYNIKETKEYIEKAIKKATEKEINNNKNFYLPPKLTDDVLKFCFEGVARFGGITNQTQIENYVNYELQRTKKYTENQFELTGIGAEK